VDGKFSAASRGERTLVPESRSGAYVLEGVVLKVTVGEAAGLQEPSEQSGRRSVAAWFITQGKVEALDVSGVHLVTVRHAVGDGQSDRAIILLDEVAAPELLLALLNLIDGRLGEPPSVLSGVDAVYQVPIDYQPESGGWSVSIPGRLRISLPAGGMPPSPQGNAAAEVSVRFPEHDLVWEEHGLDAHYGEFRFVG
jgi:hypothetical protein